MQKADSLSVHITLDSPLLSISFSHSVTFQSQQLSLLIENMETLLANRGLSSLCLRSESERISYKAPDYDPHYSIREARGAFVFEH